MTLKKMFCTFCPGIRPIDIQKKINRKIDHFIKREGKLDVLKELCQENKNDYFVVKALKAQDKFGQTPMLSAINAPENR